MMIRRVSLRKVYGSYDFDIELQDGLNFIHAPNGVGKSTVIRIIAAILSNDRSRLKQFPFESVTIEYGDGRICKVTDDVSCIEPTPCVFISPNRLYRKNPDGTVTPAIDLYERELADCADPSAIDSFFSKLRGIFGFQELTMEDGGCFVVLPNGAKVPLRNLSSGQLHIFVMFYLLTFRVVPGSIVIIDEPEISLHVLWQQQLGDVFQDYCETMGLQMIVTTHSPQIIHDKWDRAILLRPRDA